MNRILYSMCYDMLHQQHQAYKTEYGLGISCPGTATWLWLAPHKSAQDFSFDFLKHNTLPLTEIVAEHNLALACADAYGKPFSQKEMISYFLPQERKLPQIISPGELRPPTVAEMPTILEWIDRFYAEALQANLAQVIQTNLPQAGTSPKKIFDIFTWHSGEPVAMGNLTGTGETGRMNLIYVHPKFRGKGYGKAVVCALAQRIRKLSQVPVLYTAADNTAANGLYTALGFKEAGRLLEIRFDEGDIE